MTEQQPTQGGEIVARAGRYYRNTRYLMAAMLVLGGLWFAYDGWVGWPEQNRKLEEANRNLKAAQDAGDSEKIRQYSEEQKQYKHHSDYDIKLQKVLAGALPPVGLLVLAWAVYNSRGAYRLSGDTLSAPGHPDVRLDDITKIDKQKWDRKGIVYLHYTTADNRSGVIKLDDFVYDRPPTDEIFAKIESSLLTDRPAPSA